MSVTTLPRDVKVFEPFAGCPQVIFGRIAARSAAFGPNPAGGGAPVVIGSAAGSSAAAVIPRARGELTERVSNILAGRTAEAAATVVTTFAQLRRRGSPALDPAAFAGLWTTSDPRTVPMLWVGGKSLLSGEDVLVPAAAVYLGHCPPPGCPTVGMVGSTGLAAHNSWSAAVHHAVLEILERDLLYRAWYGTDQPVRVSGQQLFSPGLRRAFNDLGLRPSVLVIPGPTQTACVTVCLHTAQGDEQSFGARCTTCSATLDEAAEIAAYEALMVRWSMRTPVANRAWRALCGRDQPGVAHNMLEHALLAFHQPDSLRSWCDRSVSADSFRSGDGGAMVSDKGRLASTLAEHTGADVVAVDSTIPGVAADGLRVVRIVAPGARQLPNDERTMAASPESPGQQPGPHPFG